MSNYDEIMEIADRCDNLMKDVDANFVQMSKGGSINSTVGSTKMVNNLRKANAMFKRVDNLVSIHCLNCKRKIGETPQGWRHRVSLIYQGKTQQELEAYTRLVDSIDWSCCDNPPIVGRVATPKPNPETDYTEDERAAIEAKAKELTARYTRYLTLINQANEIAKGFAMMPVTVAADMASDAAQKVKDVAGGLLGKEDDEKRGEEDGGEV